jgi:glycosyltransferase involved in cell wall biosynthesis
MWQKVRILLVIPYFYPEWTYGGPVRIAYDVARELIKRGHGVTVYTSSQNNGCSRTDSRVKELDGIRIHYFRNASAITVREMKLFITPEMIPVVRSGLQSFDIIHIHEYRTFQNIAVHHYARKYSIPYVLQAHGSLPRIMAKQRLKWIYDVFFGYRLLRDASKVVALSQAEAEQYKRMGVLLKRIEVIPNGIDLSEYGDLPPNGSFKKKFGIGADEKIVLYVGRIHESKGLYLLAQAFKTVSEIVSNVRLVIVGPDDGYAAAFSRLLSGLGIEEKVLFTGFVEKRDKLAAFVDSDIFVTPRFSGFPVTFLEACLVGCPIVTASDELDWINNNVGYVTEHSSDALAKGVASVLQDEQANRRFRNNCRHMIKNFDILTVTRQLEKVYKEALSCDCY